MCGFIWAQLPKCPTEEQIAQASRLVARRGPSASTIEVATCGRYTQLSAHFLLDVSGSAVNQPVYFPSKVDAEFELLFNGEIYNFLKLMPSEKNDTSALVKLFSIYGKNLWKKLDGEYAILVHQKRTSRLHLACDQFLTKPLAIAFDARTGAFGVASYPSALSALGFHEPKYFQPNTSVEFDLTDPGSWPETYAHSNKNETYSYSLEQTDAQYLRWEQAFMTSVKVRATHGSLPVFVPLSSGYDSGAICLALNLQGISYTTITMQSNEQENILSERLAVNRAGSCVDAIEVEALDAPNAKRIKDLISQNCEPYEYLHHNSKENLLNDGGSLGAYRIAEIASEKNKLICLSGCGADEIISDYGFNGEKYYDHSEFGGLFPENLHGFFPWKKFYGDTMRSYLFKDEFIFGVFGIEGRYPFLDTETVQAFLSLSPDLKNATYKAPIAYFLEKYNYPYESGVKRGFSPFSAPIVAPSANDQKKQLSWWRRQLMKFV